jgi:hypothetical protein
MGKNLTPHSKDQLLTPSRAKGESTIGPSHTGAAKPGFYAGSKDAHLTVHHDPQRARGVENLETPNNIARKGAAKNLHPVSHSWGNTEQQVAMAGVGGLGHATSTAQVPDANPPNPLAKEPRGKVLKDVEIKPGMKSQSPTPLSMHKLLGAAILAQAVKSGGKIT